MKKVIIRDLNSYIGHEVAKNVYSRGQILLKQGTKLTKGIANRIRENAEDYLINFIILDTPDSKDVTIEEVITENVKIECKNKIEDTFKNFYDSNKNKHKHVKDLMNTTEIIVDEIYSKKEIINNIDMLMSAGQDLVTHSLNVSLLSTMLAAKANLSKEIIKKAAIGACFHDIGKVELFNDSPILADPEYKYEIDDYELIQSHPLLGYRKASDSMPYLSVISKRIILMHHVWEDYDKSYSKRLGLHESYPRKIRNKIILPENKDITVRIVQVADVFDAMTNVDRRYHKPKTKSEAIKYIRDAKDIRFGEAADLLVGSISPYGVGDEVIMSNGDIALVIEHTNISSRPKVKFQTGQYIGRSIDLSQELLDVIIEKEKI